MISWFSVLTALVLAFQLPAAPAPEAAPRTEAGLAVEALDRRGEPLRDPKPEDFTVTEDGAPRRVLGLETGKPWRVVVYVDRILSGTRSVRGAAGLLAAQARELTALGTVEVLVAEPEPRSVLSPTRDPIAVDEALSHLLLTGEGRDDLRMLRQRFLAEHAQVVASAERQEDLADRLGEAVAAEARLAGRQHDLLLEWLAGSRGADGPRALFLVSDGFDLDPRTPYLAEIPDEARRSALRAELPDPGLADRNRELAQTAAALGWSVLPMPVGSERVPDLSRFRTRSTEEVLLGVVITPGRKKEQPPPGSTLPELVAPRAPLSTLAEETGGEVLTTPSATASAIDRLRSRVWLRYEELEPARGELRPIEVRSASAARTTAGKWRGPAVPETIAARRALRLLSMEEDEEGDGSIETALRQATDPAGTLSWTLELRPEAPALRRLTLAIPSGTGDAISHRLLSPADLGTDGLWRVPVALSSEVDQIAIVVDDPAGGAWESRLLPVVTRDAEEPDDEPISEVAKAPVRPEPGGRGVHIVSPASGRAMGPVDVEVALDVPRDRRLERLEIFWNDELAATLYGPPYRHRVNIPRDRPVGYLRASARLNDGTIAEDAVLLNSTAVGERVDVRLIELYVVVTDRDGRPVRGLGKNDFRLLQDGREQAIAGFDDAGASPLSLGLAFDSSASMFLKLPDVREAARTLLTGGLSARDRALLVDFDSEPRLVTGMTDSLDTVSAGLGTLRADGNSDLFEAIIFSLQKLQTVFGRKALVVYSDGIGEGEKTSYRACIRAARRSNVPVYLIVTNQRAARATEAGAQGPLDAYAERLHDLATATGGRAFFVMPSQSLDEVYANILQELRSQYLLTYYPPTTAPDVWRKVQVELKKRGYQARTVSGYYAR